MYTTNISSEFVQRINTASRHFKLRLTRMDTNAVVNIDYKKATFTYGSCGGSSFTVGCSFSSYLEVTAEYSDVLLEGVEVFAEIGLFMDDGIDYSDDTKYEYCPMGYFTIQKPTKQADTMSFTGVDRMNGALSELYETHLTYPATISSVVSELATLAGVTINLTTGIGSNTLPSAMTALTCRDAVQILAILSLGYAYVDVYGNVNIKTFKSGQAVSVNYDYVKKQPEMDEAVSNIGGIQVEVTPETVDEEGDPVPAVIYSDGSGHQIKIACSYMTQDIFNTAKTNITGLAYNGGSVSFMGNPLLEVSDRVVFGRGSNTQEYSVPCMQIVHEFDGGLLTTVTAPGSFETTDETTYSGSITRFIDQQSIENEVSRTLITYAKEAAISAQQSADAAQQAADDAQADAVTANTAANGALAQLSIVEDVVGTLNWISTHGTYTATTDTAVMPGKYYFTRTGAGTEADPYTYNIVISPSGNPSAQGYYELTGVDEAVANYVATHLALTNDGLFVQMDDDPLHPGYKVKITGSGVYIIDTQGNIVATYSTETIIGNDQGGSSYIKISTNKISALSSNQNEYYEVGETSGVSYTEVFTGDGETISFYLAYVPDTVDSVTVNGTGVSYDRVPPSGSTIYINPAPASGSTVEITYTVDPQYSGRYFTFGTRTVDVPPADSVSFGTDNNPSAYSYAFGTGIKTSATVPGGIAFGRYNDPSTGRHLFALGNGTSDSNRSNALTVDWDGNLECNNIGAYKSATSSNAITSTGIDTAYVAGAHVTLEPGVWVVTGQWPFNTGSSSGVRNMSVQLAPNNSASGSGGYKMVRITAANQSWASLEVTDIITLTSQTTVYIKASSSMTYTTATTNSIKAVRIK